MKIRAGEVKRSSANIPAAKAQPDAPLTFSFKHLDLTSNPKFCAARCGDGYLEKFLGRLRDVCQCSVLEFRTNKSRSLRAHTLTWEDTTEKNGFTCLNEQLRAKEPWQFEITKDVHGRVHGFLIDATSYVVWLDPTHLLYR